MSTIEFKNIVKSYDDCHACDSITFTIQLGTIHALMGENGAGKSTLMKIFGGLEQPDSGEMYLRGKLYSPTSVKVAFQNKIGFVHQHFLLAENRTVLEHLILNWPVSSLLRPINTTTLLKKVYGYLEKFNWKLNFQTLISELSVGEQQRIEIIRALLTDPDIIIFDEPTAVLAPQEVAQFLAFLKQLQAEKKTILLISHKLTEIKQVSDYVTILRHGKSILTTNTSALSLDEIAEHMIGRKQQSPNMQNSVDKVRKPLLHLRGLEIQTHEILGVAGIEGHGQSQFILDLLHSAKENKISTADIAEDRLKFGLFTGACLADHILLRHPDRFSRHGFIDTKKMNAATLEILNTWDVRPRNPQIEIENLSGGNQQKFVVGRELHHNPSLIIAANPTRGVDLGAQGSIHAALINRANAGSSVVLISADLDEVLKLSSRFCILFEYKLHGPFKRGQLSEAEIGQYMTGSHPLQTQAQMKDPL